MCDRCANCTLIAPRLHPNRTVMTREVVLRCHVRQSTLEDAWIVVPHVGCSHQHARFVLSAFADQPVSLEQMLMPWDKRMLTSRCARTT